MCSSSKNPYPLQGRSSKIPRGTGVLKGKMLEVKYETKLEFLGERGVQNKNTFHEGSVDISGTKRCQLNKIFIS